MSYSKKSTGTKKDRKPSLVPALRFPEFREAEGWNATPLGELGAIVTGKTPSTKEDDLWGGEILFITPTDITEDEKYQHTTQRTVVETTGTKVLPPGSVVYTCIASIGKMALTVVPSVTNQQINAVVPDGKTAGEFIYYSLANLTPWIKSIPATSTLPIINKTQFSGFIIPHPEDKAEQQRISECLRSVDRVIAAQARKVDALRTHKKGLRQQLFPREGETQPRLRFPEFQNEGEWKTTSFGALGLDVSDGNYSSKYPSQSDFVANGVPFLRANNLKFGTVTDDDMRFISQEQHSQITKGHLTQGDILITTRGELGTVALVPDRHIGSNINAQIVRNNTGSKLVNTFLFHLLDYSRVIGLFDALSTGTALKQLPIGKLNQLALCIPEIREEQQLIADCLSSLDALITAETQKFEALKLHKKGLMQQLFPSPEEAGT